MKKSVSQKRREKEQQENKALQRVLNIFLLGLAAECFLFFVYRGYAMGTVDSVLTWDPILRAISQWGLLVVVIAAVAAVVLKKNRKARVPLTWVSGVSLFLWVSSFMSVRFFNNSRGIVTMCVLVPALTILGIVYLLFQRECFLSTIALSGSILTAWLLGLGAQGTIGILIKVGSVMAVLILAALLLFSLKAQKAQGKLGELEIFTADCRYPVLYAALAVGLVCILAALVLPAYSYYILWVLGIAAFGELVYFTTQLM